MDAFEHIAVRYFDALGYWTRVGVKIELTKAEKRELGNPSMPRPEVDIVAYRVATNDLLIIECKSYLDSYGVRIENFFGDSQKHKDRIKLLTRHELRTKVTEKLIQNFRQEGLIASEFPKVKYGLVAGKIYSSHESKLKEIFEDNHWLFVSPSELAKGLRKFASRGYENDIVTMVVKILERNKTR
jgi:hypothetical protein